MAFRNPALVGGRNVGRGIVASCFLLACASHSSDAPAGGGAVVVDGPCLGSSGPTFLVTGIARGIAVDDSFVYTATNDGIVRAPRAGGAVEKLASSGSPVALAADGTSLYFFGSHPAGAPDADGKVMSSLALYALPLTGGTPHILVDGAYGQVLLSDGTNLYSSDAAGVHQLPLAGGAGAVSMIERAATVEAMALGRDAIFLAVYTIGIGGAPSAGSIRRMPRGGGAVSTIVSGLDHPTSLALDADRLYFTDAGSFDGAAVRSARLDGSDLTTIAMVASSSVAVDAHAVYYTSGDGIVKVDKASGASSELVTGLRTPGNLVIRSGNLYWANATSVALSDPDPPYGIMTACK